jgi:hypothetical protein
MGPSAAASGWRRELEFGHLRNIREPIPLLRGTVSKIPVESAAVSAAERRQSLATGASPWEPFCAASPGRGVRFVARILRSSGAGD